MQIEGKTRRIRSLIIISVMAAIVMSVSTYAWFIGMRTVNVASFDVEIKSTESLMLSLDGAHWASQINISEALLDTVSYSGHTNNWPELIPVSTVGEMDDTVSRMMLYEKSSYTASPGGYRIMTSRVKNNEGAAGDGYVVFDLFVRNFSGNDYNETEDQTAEEAIYLTTDSEAKVSLTGAPAGVALTGIENAVRVAFTQIGRVVGTQMNAGVITGITCAGSVENKVTGLCRNAQIWEPNDRAHVDAAVSYYNHSCLQRTAVTGAYNETPCKTITVAPENYYHTYAVNSVIGSADKVDIYDGADYNNFSSAKLTEFDYFTDTEKNLTGTLRPTFMTLAANSVTKVRVYIYIEGQDIDNYNFSEIGRKIAINFGFTKERFVPGDIEYTGPTLDTLAPIITLTGDKVMTVAVSGTYTEPGATALDNVDGDITANIIIDSSKVNTALAGTYAVYYNVTDAAGNKAEVIRTVIVE
jgi:hypothetical protein